MNRSLLLLLLVSLLSACSRSLYKEEFHLNVDGSGEIRIDGMQELVFSINKFGSAGNTLPISTDTVRRRFDSPKLGVIEVRQSIHAGRTFLHLRAGFDDINQLGDHPVFSQRRFRLKDTPEHFLLTVDVPRGLGPRNSRSELPAEGWITFQAHFPSPVESHNSPSGVGRGNIITWKESLVEFEKGGVLHLEARFLRRTVFEETMLLLGASIAVVILLITGALFVIYRIGKRQITSKM